MTLEEAGKALSDAGLSLNDKIEETNDDAPAGEIVSQNPAAARSFPRAQRLRSPCLRARKKLRFQTSPACHKHALSACWNPLASRST